MIKSIFPKIKERMLPSEGIKHFVNDDTNLIRASINSKTGYSVPELVVKYGKGLPGFSVKTFPVMFSTIRNARKSYKDCLKNPPSPKTEASENFIEEFVEYIKSLGILNVRFIKVDPNYIFKNSSVLYDNAIVFTMEMGKTAIGEAPSKITGHEIHLTYNKLGLIANKIAQYLRKNGYGAQAGPALCGDVNYILLAEKAGLGSIGRHGLLISPQVGPRQRIAAVYTTIENLPFNNINNHLWIKDFCDKCNKCVNACPSQAIYNKPVDDLNNTIKYIDNKKCAVSFARNCGCTVCIKECTFNNNDYDKIKESFMK